MGRTPQFDRLARIRDVARWCDELGVSTDEGIARLAERQTYPVAAVPAPAAGVTRRDFLATAGKVAAAASVAAYASRFRPARAAKQIPGVDVAIVGAGLAGLACADDLRRNGVVATVYDANDRVGGRCFSLRGVFPGQVAERGAEFIDTLHKTMLGYANAFDLALEDVTKDPGETFYYIDGEHHAERDVVDEYRALVPAMRKDIQSSSGAPTADAHSPGDVLLDHTTLREWLTTRGAGPLIAGVIEAAYVGEYGREIDEQSCLNLLFFMHSDRRAKFAPFGVFSDERYHVVGGNDLIAQGLGDRLDGQLDLGRRLVAAEKDFAGRIVLRFADGGTASADAVVFALPFSTLRDVDLGGLALPAWKQFAIDNLVYGTNAKLLMGFGGRPWADAGGNGGIYADLDHLQGTWETNAARATSTHAVLTDFTGGHLGAGLDPANVQPDAEAFLADLDVVVPGAAAAATRVASGDLLADLWHWPTQPLWKGSYTCGHPGYFTTIANNEGKPVGNVYFAGEHTSSFYEWQGFMEGAVTTGLRAAGEIVRAFRKGA